MTQNENARPDDARQGRANAFLWEVLNNHFIDELRKKKALKAAEQKLQAAVPEKHQMSPADQAIVNEIVQKLLDPSADGRGNGDERLTPYERFILIEYYLSDRSDREICEFLRKHQELWPGLNLKGPTPRGVLTKRHDGLRKLGDYFGDDEPGEDDLGEEEDGGPDSR